MRNYIINTWLSYYWQSSPSKNPPQHLPQSFPVLTLYPLTHPATQQPLPPAPAWTAPVCAAMASSDSESLDPEDSWSLGGWVTLTSSQDGQHQRISASFDPNTENINKKLFDQVVVYWKITSEKSPFYWVDCSQFYKGYLIKDVDRIMEIIQTWDRPKFGKI